MSKFHGEFHGAAVYILEMGDNHALLDVATAKMLRDSLNEFILKSELVIDEDLDA